jgi:hypothetical protein
VLWGQDNLFDDRKLNFDDGTKVGIADVIRLPPGDCEIHNFRLVSRDFYVGSRKARREFKSKEDFSLLFTIRPEPANIANSWRLASSDKTRLRRGGRISCCRTWRTAISRLRSASSRRCPKSPLPFPT